MSILHNFLRWLGRSIFRVVVRVEVQGLERFPAAGPVLVVNNHVNFLDGLLTVIYFPRRVLAFTKAEHLEKKSPLALLLRIWGAIPVRRETLDVEALRSALAALEAGKVLLIDPEGTRSHHGRLQEARPGVVFLAQHSGAAILPVAIWGQEHFRRNLLRLRRTAVTIWVGQPFTLAGEGCRIRREERGRMLSQVMYQLAALLPPDYRGAYADLEHASDDSLIFPPEARGTKPGYFRSNR